MRTFLICLTIQLCGAGLAQAQTNCMIDGYLYNPDGSPAAQAQLNVVNVVNSGSSYVLTPVVLTTDANGLTSFTAPRLSTVWILATALGLTGPGDVAILIPDADSATLQALAQSAKPPVSGFSLTSGPSPTLALSLQDFGINLNAAPTPPPTTVESFNGRSGAVTLTSSDISTALNYTPLDPATVIGAVNASSAQIDDARLSAEVVRRSLANAFAAQQTFSSGIHVTGSNAPGSSAATIVKGSRTSSALDFRLDLTGKAIQFFSPGEVNPRTYFNSRGMLYTVGWMVVSGKSHGTGDGYAIDHPTADPFMVGVWSDILGPAVQVRAASGPGAYLFSGLDNLAKYRFSIEADGGLKWGASTRAGMDTNLYRTGVNSLKTDGSLAVGKQFVFDGGTNPTADLFTAITNNGRYQWTIGSVPNPFDPNRQDQAMTLGWNTTADGGRLSANEPSLAFRLENYYTPTADQRWMEAHLQYNSVAGKTFRPWAYQVDRASDLGSFQVSTDSFIYAGSDGRVPYAQFSSSGLTLRNSATLFSLNNNVQMLRQRNAANTGYITIAYADAANRVSIGNNSAGVISAAPYLQIGNGTGPKIANFGNAGVSILKENGTGALIVGAETTTPVAAAPGEYKLYAKKNSAGKTQLCVMFSSGPEQCFATQP